MDTGDALNMFIGSAAGRIAAVTRVAPGLYRLYFGVVLVGDAAGSTDPSWGSGLARTLRDVRLLRDALTTERDWPRAADEYAEQHDDFWERLRDVERLSAAALMAVGPDGASRRERAFGILETVPELEIWTYGPEAHCDDAVRAALLA
jgi:2-polyprenyl-6-methoxyphenol hydroxylase-like FAD-dependent oxidoreductase